MKLRVYHAGDGDCLLLRSDDNTRNLLIDGGRVGTFDRHTAGDLSMPRLDLVCVSHIDDDHISGILRMFDTEVAWRRHEFAQSRGLPTRKPRQPRPPDVDEIWHNALFALVGDDLELRAQNALLNTASLRRAQGRESLALQTENLIQGERSAMKLARRISNQQLGIELNDSSGGGLLTRDSARDRRFGRLRVKLIGPSQDDIDRLRVSWRAWIEANPTAIHEIREAMRQDESELANASTNGAPVALDLGTGASSITPPNLASIMMMVEEGTTSVLLTGDGSSAEILEGLQAKREIKAGGTRHVTVFKVPHHGAEANNTPELVSRITADNYVFCGNGAHDNPEFTVVEGFANARLVDRRGPNQPFTFWFSSGSQTRGLTTKRRKHMVDVEARVATLVGNSSGQMTAHFVQRDSHLDVL